MTRKVEKEKEKEMDMKPVLSMLGPRPGSEAVEAAKQAVTLIDRRLAVESTAQDLPVSEPISSVSRNNDCGFATMHVCAFVIGE